MKIIFLDVDGVLNCTSRWKGGSGKHLDAECLANLKKIVDETQCKIVVSSTWRILHETMADLLDALEKIGLKEFVIGKTPKGGQERVNQITEWLMYCRNDVESFAILDDDSDASDGKNFFKINGRVGLTADDAAAIIKHLNKG